MDTYNDPSSLNSSLPIDQHPQRIESSSLTIESEFEGGHFSSSSYFPHDLSQGIARSVSSLTKTLLSDIYEPSDYDVICGKGKTCFEHVGNHRFRVTVNMQLDKYSAAATKLAKSSIVTEIIDTVRRHGQFVKYDTKSGRWFEVGNHLAREKVGQTIRDALHLQYKSSTKAKKKRREAEQAHSFSRSGMIESTRLGISEISARIQAFETENTLTDLFTTTNNNLDILNQLQRMQAQMIHSMMPIHPDNLASVDISACKQETAPPDLNETVSSEYILGCCEQHAGYHFLPHIPSSHEYLFVDANFSSGRYDYQVSDGVSSTDDGTCSSFSQ